MPMKLTTVAWASRTCPQGTGGAQKRSVTSDYDDEVALLPEPVACNDGQIVIRMCLAAPIVEYDIQPAGAQHADQPSQRLAHPSIAVLGDKPDGPKLGRDQGLCALWAHAGVGIVEYAGDSIMSAPTGASERCFCTAAERVLA